MLQAEQLTTLERKIERFTAILQDRPGDELTVLALAEASFRRGLKLEALKAYQEVIRQRPVPEAHLAVAEIYSDQAMFAEAYGELRQLFELDPDSVEARLLVTELTEQSAPPEDLAEIMAKPTSEKAFEEARLRLQIQKTIHTRELQERTRNVTLESGVVIHEYYVEEAKKKLIGVDDQLKELVKLHESNQILAAPPRPEAVAPEPVAEPVAATPDPTSEVAEPVAALDPGSEVAEPVALTPDPAPGPAEPAALAAEPAIPEPAAPVAPPEPPAPVAAIPELAAPEPLLPQPISAEPANVPEPPVPALDAAASPMVPTPDLPPVAAEPIPEPVSDSGEFPASSPSAPLGEPMGLSPISSMESADAVSSQREGSGELSLVEIQPELPPVPDANDSGAFPGLEPLAPLGELPEPPAPLAPISPEPAIPEASTPEPPAPVGALPEPPAPVAPLEPPAPVAAIPEPIAPPEPPAPVAAIPEPVAPPEPPAPVAAIPEPPEPIAPPEPPAPVAAIPQPPAPVAPPEPPVPVATIPEPAPVAPPEPPAPVAAVPEPPAMLEPEMPSLDMPEPLLPDVPEALPELDLPDLPEPIAFDDPTAELPEPPAPVAAIPEPPAPIAPPEPPAPVAAIPEPPAPVAAPEPPAPVAPPEPPAPVAAIPEPPAPVAPPEPPAPVAAIPEPPAPIAPPEPPAPVAAIPEPPAPVAPPEPPAPVAPPEPPAPVAAIPEPPAPVAPPEPPAPVVGSGEMDAVGTISEARNAYYASQAEGLSALTATLARTRGVTSIFLVAREGATIESVVKDAISEERIGELVQESFEFLEAFSRDPSYWVLECAGGIFVMQKLDARHVLIAIGQAGANFGALRYTMDKTKAKFEQILSLTPA